MHASRKSHRKSRQGCLNCKKRKIKCDEQKPSCGNCIKHSIQCDFALGGASGVTNRSQTSLLPPQDGHSPSSSVTEGYQEPGLNMQDLELLHNYSTSTALTMTANHELKSIWRINIPQLAFSHEYLMRAILAISALHLAHSKPAQRDHYLHQASKHQDVALRTAAPLLAHPDESNCNALYAMTAMTFVYSLASPQKPKDFLLTREEGVTSWLTLLRGIRNLIQPNWRWLISGPLGPMFKIGRHRVQFLQNEGDEDHLPDLRRLVIDQGSLPPADIEAYRYAIDLLNPLFGSLFREERIVEYTEVVTFVYRLEDRFLTNLMDREAHALVIMAYYCVLLKQLEHHWWVGNWGVSLLSRIYELLDAEHRLWIQWPIEEMGWIP